MTAKLPAKLAEGVVNEPLKIVIGGSSASLYVTPARSRRDEGTYGELLPRMLATRGITAVSTHTGQWYGMINNLRRRYEPAVRNHFPDVLILNFGTAEYQPNFLPMWLSRHFVSWDVSSVPIAVGYRRHVLARLWPLARRWQRFAAARTSNHSWRLSPKRFAREMQRVIELAREETGCLVLVLDADPPGDRITYWMPGTWQRWERYQALLRNLIDGLADPEVRLVPASSTILELGFDVAMPDGFHRSAAGHRASADMLLAEILKWLDEPTERRPDTALSTRGIERRPRGE